MSDFLKGLLQFLLGAGGLALINVVQERWKWKADRKAKLDDKADEKRIEREKAEKEREDMLAGIDRNLTEYIERQDRFNADLVERVEELEIQNVAQNEGMKFVLLDRILHLGEKYISVGEVSFDDRKRLGDMHTVYHKRLGGNGDADAIMDSVYELPLKK